MTNWQLDSSHLHVGFAVKHLMVATVRGSFSDVQADIHIDEDAPERSSVDVRIATASVNSGQEQRDAHLRSADFFDAERFPEIRFRSAGVERGPDNRFTLSGDLTVRDVTLPVRLEGELDGPVTDPWGGRRAGFSLTGELDREAFGLTWNLALEAGGMTVGRKVKVVIEGEMVATPSEASTTASPTEGEPAATTA